MNKIECDVCRTLNLTVNVKYCYTRTSEVYRVQCGNWISTSLENTERIVSYAFSFKNLSDCSRLLSVIVGANDVVAINSFASTNTYGVKFIWCIFNFWIYVSSLYAVCTPVNKCFRWQNNVIHFGWHVRGQDSEQRELWNQWQKGNILKMLNREKQIVQLIIPIWRLAKYGRLEKIVWYKMVLILPGLYSTQKIR